MAINTQAIEEFKQIYKTEYGEDLTGDDALEIGTRLVNLFEILCSKPNPNQENE